MAFLVQGVFSFLAIVLVYYFGFFVSALSIPGIILGIIGLESTQKNKAILGIIFSVIGFIFMIFIVYARVTTPKNASFFGD